MQAFCRNFDYASVHSTGAQRIAKVATENGVSRLIHVSHLNASPNSTSAYYRTKAEGEELVKAAFPNATIVRPAALFGYEDKLLNSIARKPPTHAIFAISFTRPPVSGWPIWFKLNHGRSEIRPVHVRGSIY